MSAKREKFVSLAEKRVNRAIKDIQLIGNLSNKNNYQYSDDDIEIIVKALEFEIKEMKSRFKPTKNLANVGFKLSRE